MRINYNLFSLYVISTMYIFLKCPKFSISKMFILQKKLNMLSSY